MGDDDAFRQAIAARPEDRLVKLAYADWLDDRGEDEAADWMRWWATAAAGVPADEWEPFRHGLDSDAYWLWTWAAGRPRLTPADGYRPPQALNQLLEWFAAANSNAGDEYRFYAAPLALGPAPAAAVAAWFSTVRPPHIELHPLPDPAGGLAAVLGRWLFRYTELWAALPAGRRAGAAGRVVAAVADALPFDAGHRVDILGGGWDEVAWDDLLLVQGDRGLFLHLGVSD